MFPQESRRFLDLSASRAGGHLVPAMAPDAPEFLVGCVNDPLFGPVIACGAGGRLAELLGDAPFRLPPLSASEASATVGGLRSARLPRGFRRATDRDEEALTHALVRLAALVEACPEIVTIDLNPVGVYERGVLVLDARIRVAALQWNAIAQRVDYEPRISHRLPRTLSHHTAPPMRGIPPFVRNAPLLLWQTDCWKAR